MRSLRIPVSIEPRSPEARPRRVPIIVMLALFALPILAGCSQQSSSSSGASTADDPLVARVNGIDIRQSHLTIAEEDLGADLERVPAEVKQEQILAYVADIIMVAQAGEQKKLQDSDEFKRRIAFLRSKLMMGLMLQTAARDSANDDSLRKVYDEQIRPMGATEEVKARHILFRADPKDEKALAEAEAKARAALARIKGGEEFAKVASELTEDPTGKENGGQLDYFTKQQMVPEFANVAFQMFPGQISNPVRTQFGWHLIQMEDKRNRPVPEFDKVKDQIEAFVVRRAQTELISQLRERAKIERLDKKGATVSPTMNSPPPVSVPPADASPPAEKKQ